VDRFEQALVVIAAASDLVALTADLDTIVAALHGRRRIRNHRVAGNDRGQRVPRSEEVSARSGVSEGKGLGTLPRRVELGAWNRACTKDVEASLAIGCWPAPDNRKILLRVRRPDLAIREQVRPVEQSPTCVG
jgi:hypothetical protein